MPPTDWTDLALLAPHVVALFFACAFGACVGSFINVVAWRMPQGVSIVAPPSRCPTCGYRLRWYDNVPIFGYLRLRGRCAACGVHIPIHYLAIELAMALLFAGIYMVLYLPAHDSFWNSVGDGWWRGQGLARSVPALVVVLYAVSALAAMTLSDARTYLIPLTIPVSASIVAFVGWLVQAGVVRSVLYPWPIPVPMWPVLLGGIGGLVGVLVSLALLRAGVLKESFADYDSFVKEGDTFAEYPHARREMGRELAFLTAPVACMALGVLLSRTLIPVPEGGVAAAPLWVQALGACATGFVGGGAIIWVVRILVTFLLGVEAMGLGDVHLMACVGAAFGWRAVVVGFLVAPFVGLAWWLANLVRHAPLRVPFGPSLAVGGISAFFLWPVIRSAIHAVMGAMAFVADHARDHTQLALILSVVLGVGAVACAWQAGRLARGPGVWVAGSILLMVGGVMSWVFGSPAGVSPMMAGGAALAVAAGVSARLARAHTEPEAGPRTALARIMVLLVFVVVFLGLFLVLVR